MRRGALRTSGLNTLPCAQASPHDEHVPACPFLAPQLSTSVPCLIPDFCVGLCSPRLAAPRRGGQHVPMLASDPRGESLRRFHSSRLFPQDIGVSAAPALYQCSSDAVPRQYHCGPRRVPMHHQRRNCPVPAQHHCITSIVPIRYQRSTSAVPIQYVCSTSAALAQFQRSASAVPV